MYSEKSKSIALADFDYNLASSGHECFFADRNREAATKSLRLAIEVREIITVTLLTVAVHNLAVKIYTYKRIGVTV